MPTKTERNHLSARTDKHCGTLPRAYGQLPVTYVGIDGCQPAATPEQAGGRAALL